MEGNSSCRSRNAIFESGSCERHEGHVGGADDAYGKASMVSLPSHGCPMTYSYTPTDTDVQWAQRLLGSMADGGTWGIPRSGVVFKIDHGRKVVLQIDGPSSGKAYEIEIAQNRAVFGRLGYKVVGKGDGNDFNERHWEEFRRKDLRLHTINLKLWLDGS
jgi:hypothetical protein